jgi:hypothetical protein
MVRDSVEEADQIVQLIVEKITEPKDEVDNSRSLLFPKAEDRDLRAGQRMCSMASKKTSI